MAESFFIILKIGYKCIAKKENKNIEENIKIPKNKELRISSHGKKTKISWKDNKKNQWRYFVSDNFYDFYKKIKPLMAIP